MEKKEAEENGKSTYDLSKVEPYYDKETQGELRPESEDDLSVKAKRAADAFHDLITSAAHKAKEAAAQKTKEIASVKDFDGSSVSAAKDARDISSLGLMVEDLARHFEGTMIEMEKRSYSEQTELLTGYSKLLEEQVKVIDARLHYVKRI
jgi:hypothetical protein